jgi:hypothetical protein
MNVQSSYNESKAKETNRRVKPGMKFKVLIE